MWHSQCCFLCQHWWVAHGCLPVSKHVRLPRASASVHVHCAGCVWSRIMRGGAARGSWHLSASVCMKTAAARACGWRWAQLLHSWHCVAGIGETSCTSWGGGCIADHNRRIVAVVVDPSSPGPSIGRCALHCSSGAGASALVRLAASSRSDSPFLGA